MTEVLKKITVDLSRKSGKRPVFAVQNDVGARNLEIMITDDGAPYVFSDGTVATINYKRPDGVSGALVARVVDGGVAIALSPTILGAVGQTICTVSLYDENKSRITSSEFCLDVCEEIYSGEGIEVLPEYSLLESIFAQISVNDLAEKARNDAEIERETAEEAREEAEKSRALAEEARGRAIEDFEREIEGSLAAHEADVSTTLEGFASRIGKQDIEIASFKTSVNEQISEHDDEISDFKSAVNLRIAAQDSKLKGRLGLSAGLWLKSADWSEDLKQTVSIGGLGQDDLVIFFPSSRIVREQLSQYGVFVHPLPEGGVFTVSASVRPEIDMVMYYYIIRAELPTAEV